MDFNCERSEPNHSVGCLWGARLAFVRIPRLTMRSDFRGSHGAQACGLTKGVCAIRALPSEPCPAPSEVSISSGGFVDRAAQVENFDDALGRQREELADQRRDFLLRDGSRSESLGHHGHWLGNA